MANTYVQTAAPWSTLRNDQPGAALANRTALRLIEIFAIVAQSIIPNLATSAIAASVERSMDVHPAGRTTSSTGFSTANEQEQPFSQRLSLWLNSIQEPSSLFYE